MKHKRLRRRRRGRRGRLVEEKRKLKRRTSKKNVEVKKITNSL